MFLCGQESHQCPFARSAARLVCCKMLRARFHRLPTSAALLLPQLMAPPHQLVDTGMWKAAIHLYAMRLICRRKFLTVIISCRCKCSIDFQTLQILLITSSINENASQFCALLPMSCCGWALTLPVCNCEAEALAFSIIQILCGSVAMV